MLRFSNAAERPGRPAPELGQHTREILAEFSYSSVEIEKLFETNVIR